MQKYHIITFGCQMNKSDSERIAGLLEQLNYSRADKIELADIVVINACSVRQKPIDRIWGLLKNLKQLKKGKPLKLILTGCVLPEDGKAFKKKFDFVFKIKNLYQLEEFLTQERKILDKDYFHVFPKLEKKYSAFVPVMTGCNNFCSYCAVPYVRGSEVSRSSRDVLGEIKKLAKKGVKEIILLGQNVNSYHPKDDCFSKDNPYKQKFAKLLFEINKIKGIKRINFVSSHPKDMDEDLIKALALPRMSNYLHLALQSGDNFILEKMNRGYTIEKYKKLIQKVRQVRPGIAIGTDLIVGFPGESEDQFNNTVKAYCEIDFDIAYTAMYSPRKGTKAAEMKDNVSLKKKKERWQKVQKLMEETTLKKNQKYVGKNVEVLVDKISTNSVQGNSSEMKRVKIKDCQAKLGDIVKVKIKQAQEWLLIA